MSDNAGKNKAAVAILHAYYGLLCLLVSPLYWRILSAWNERYIPAEPIELFAWIPAAYYIPLIKVCIASGWVALAASALYPWSRTLRILSTLGLLVAIGAISTYGKVTHGYYGWLFASMMLILLPHKEAPRSNESIWQTLFAAQFAAVICYGMAGIWKLRAIPAAYAAHGWEGLIGSLPSAIAYEHLTRAHEVTPITQFFLDHELLTGLMYFGLIALQVTAPLLALIPRLHLLLGLSLVSFHLLSEIIVRIEFRPQLYLVVLLLVFSPFQPWVRALFNNVLRRDLLLRLRQT